MQQELRKTFQEMKNTEWGAFSDGQNKHMSFKTWVIYELWNGKRYSVTPNFNGFDDDDPQMEEWLYVLEQAYFGEKV